MTMRAIKIIKPNQKRITHAVAPSVTRELTEIELTEKRVVTVNNWISERRKNDFGERNDSRTRLAVWQNTNLASAGVKI